MIGHVDAELRGFDAEEIEIVHLAADLPQTGDGVAVPIKIIGQIIHILKTGVSGDGRRRRSEDLDSGGQGCVLAV